MLKLRPRFGGFGQENDAMDKEKWSLNKDKILLSLFKQFQIVLTQTSDDSTQAKEVLGGQSPKEPLARKRHGLTGLGKSFPTVKTRAS